MKALLWRIFSTGASRSAHRYSKSSLKADYINDLVYGSTQTMHKYGAWDPTIRRPFTFPLPTPTDIFRRFNPPLSLRNCLYGSLTIYSAAHEAAYHFMRERVGKGMSATAEERRSIGIAFTDPKTLNIQDHPNIKQIMDRHRYEPSWAFTAQHPEQRSILYPSCRDAMRPHNIITYDLEVLAKSPQQSHILTLAYRDDTQSTDIFSSTVQTPDLPAQVKWKDVS